MDPDHIRSRIVAEDVALNGERDLIRGGLVGSPQGVITLAIMAVGAILAHIIDEQTQPHGVEGQGIGIDDEADGEGLA